MQKQKKFKTKVLWSVAASVLALGSVSAVAVACNDSKKLEVKNFYAAPRGETTPEYLSAYNALINDGARFLALYGFYHGSHLAKGMEGNGLRNNTVAVYVDDKFSGKENVDRVASVQFRVDHAAFLAGIAGAYHLNSNQKTYLRSGVTELTWAGIVGLPFSSTSTFIQGFKLGVAWANQNLKDKDIAQKDDTTPKKWKEVKQVFADLYASGSFNADEPKAGQIMDQLISKKASLVLMAAGGQGNIAINKIINASHPMSLVGVDTAQEKDNSFNKARLTNTDLNNGKPVLFSIVKRVDIAGYAVMNSAKEGKQIEKDLKKDAYKLGTHTLASFDESTFVKGNALVQLSEAGRGTLIEAYKLVDPSVTDYNSVVAKVSQDEIFKILDIEKSEADLDSLLDHTMENGAKKYTKVKDEHKNKSVIELQKLLGGDVYVDKDGTVYPYRNNKSSYLGDKTADTATSSTKFKEAWDAAKPEDRVKLIKMAIEPAGRINDKSFQQTGYNALYQFYKENGIDIPEIK